MSSFEPRAAGSIVTQPDPTKHVNYNLGMVLGVDDFTQEFAYVSGRDQWTARDLLGYGTACGLRVTIETEGSTGPQVVVTPGAAVSPRGQLIRVKPTQCAYLNDWLKLDKNKPTLDRIAGPTSTLRLYVVLCYRECKTDQVPIPGEPCRSEEESMAASRVADDFSLELRFNAPDQREEDALRDFVTWLGQMEVTDATIASVPKDQFEAAIRNSAHLLTAPLASPPSSPPADYMYGSPPASMRIRTADACEYLRAAFRIWVTELRPIWLGQGQTASGNLPTEDCVLLAELSVPILKAGTQWAVDDNIRSGVKVNEERRPFLLHLRMLQEWIECGRRERSPSDTVQGERHFGQQPRAGISNAYSRADHTHGTPDMIGDVTVNNINDKTVVGALRGKALDPNVANPNEQDVLRYSEGIWKAAPVPPVALNGDVNGMANGNTVDRLQGIPIIFRTGDRELEPGQVLMYMNEKGGDVETIAGGGSGGSPTGKGGPDGTTSDRRISDPPIDDGPPKPPDDDKIPDDVKKEPIVPGIGWWQASYIQIQGAPVVRADDERKPLDNQVLTYSEGDGLWVGMDLPALDGDVVGTLRESKVNAIRGVRVFFDENNPPQEGQVLGFVQTRSKEEPLRLEPVEMAAAPGRTAIAGLDGDVTGPPDNTRVTRLQGFDVVRDDAHPPLPNQVLTFVKVGAEPGKWQAMNLPAGTGTTSPPSGGGATPNLAGDVTGAPGSNTVRKIQGTTVADLQATPPQENQVLTFKGGTWTAQALPAAPPPPTPPAPGTTVTAQTAFGQASSAGNSNLYSRTDHTHGTPPLPTMQGDVTGRTDLSVVTRIQGVPVNGPSVVSYQPGAVLTFRNGSWTPELSGTSGQPAPTSVQHPDIGPYSIVAAGIVRGDGTVRGSVGYNGLSASMTGAGRLTITFIGYENPDKADPRRPFFYIVKALPVNNPDAKVPMMPVVLFDTYQQSSLVLRVVDSGAFIDQETLTKMEFMLEISRYDMDLTVSKF